MIYLLDISNIFIFIISIIYFFFLTQMGFHKNLPIGKCENQPVQKAHASIGISLGFDVVMELVSTEQLGTVKLRTSSGHQCVCVWIKEECWKQRIGSFYHDSGSEEF